MELTRHQQEELLWLSAHVGANGFVGDALDGRVDNMTEGQRSDLNARYAALKKAGYADVKFANDAPYSVRITEEGRCEAESIIENRLRLVPKEVADGIRDAIAANALSVAASILLSAV